MAPECEKIDNMINRTFRDCKIESKIAVGGFGTVYKALDTKLGVYRAIKIFHPHLSEETGFRKRFETEMRLLACLDHPNIVRIIGAIDEPDASGFIMEFVEGETLGDILKKGIPLSIPQIIQIFTQVAKSIAYAHNLKNQIIHRDLSPDNIMIRPDGVVKIMDFGIAKTIGSERVTQTGIVLGKPTYMAPEQFEGTVSIYTDQYALGVILFEMVTGKVPFEADSPIALYKLHLNQDPPKPTDLNPNVPKNIEYVILKSLEKEEQDRFPSVDAMLEKLLGGDTGDSLDNKIPNLLFQSSEYLKENKYEEALECVQKALSYEPTNKEALAQKQEILYMQKKQHDQDMIEEWFYQAQEFYKSDMLDEARNSTLDFLKLARHYAASHIVQTYTKKLQRTMLDIYNAASEELEKDQKKVEQLTLKGKSYFQKDAFNDAMLAFDEALELDPYNDILIRLKNLTSKKMKIAEIATYYKNGIQAIKQEEYQKALDSFDQVLELYPNHPEAKKYREIALSELDRIKKTRSEVESAYQEAMSFYEKWDFAQAIDKFEEVLKIDSSHEQAQILLTECKNRIADENKIEEIGFFYTQGLGFYRSQQWEKAITCFNRVLKYMENHKGALEYKALAEEKLAIQTEVESKFQEALECFRNSMYAEALEKIEYILSKDKNHKGAKQYQALCQELSQDNN